MTSTPVWFGPAARPLFGWFHTPPTGQARGGVVICPPFVREHLQAHYTLRLLAEELEARGLAVLRFDYDGMGDSAGDSRDPGRVGAWVRSVREAMDLLSMTGLADVSLVGMRIGAVLAAQAAADRGLISQLVLWDPCVSGRSYLREQAALTLLALRGEPLSSDGSVDTPGLSFSRDTVRELRGLSLDGIGGPVARRLLVLTRPDRDRFHEVMTRLGTAGAEHREAAGQGALMDAEMPHLQIPYTLVADVADWLGKGLPAMSRPVRTPPRAGRAMVARTPAGDRIVEHPVFVPSAGLFGMVTEPEEATGQLPAAAFINVSNGHHIGPNRMWVDLARRWAGYGIRSIRFDLSGLGESPLRSPEQEKFVPRQPQAFADVADAVRAVSPTDPRHVVLVGHCASAYQALESAIELGVGGVVALNPVLTFVPPELERGQPLDRHRRVALPRTPVIQSFHGTGRLSGLRSRFSPLGWRIRLWSHPRRRPASWLRTLIGAGTDVFIVTGEREIRPFETGGLPRHLRTRLERTGLLRIEHREDLDHGLLISHQRQLIADLATERVLGRFRPAAVPVGQDRPPVKVVPLSMATLMDGSA